jgi:hypothetical protein
MIHALPGMGADHRSFPPPWTELSEFVAHDWIQYSGEITIRDVATTLCERYAIQDGDSLVGASLGGIVACEITNIREIPALYLVGSAIRKQEISSLLRALSPLAKIAPIELIQISAGKLPYELTQMFAGVDAAFIRAMCAAILEWEGISATSTEVFRIHGRNDLVIPLPAQVDLSLDGGHLISMTHAAECVEFIRANRC